MPQRFSILGLTFCGFLSCSAAHCLADDVSVLGPAVANYVTGTMDGYFTWYEQGFNPNAPTTGLPPAGVVQSEANPNWSFRLQPYDQNNVLLMNATAPTGTMTLSNANALTNVALAYRPARHRRLWPLLFISATELPPIRLRC